MAMHEPTNTWKSKHNQGVAVKANARNIRTKRARKIKASRVRVSYFA